MVAFQVPAYRWLWGSALLTTSAFISYNLGQGWLLLEMTGSPFLVGLAAGLSGFTALLTSIWGGVLADRLDRRRVLMAGQMIMAVILVSLGLLAVADVIRTWHIMLAATVYGIVRGTHLPARNSLTFDIVGRDRVQNAIGGQFMAANAAFIVGPLVAGFVLDGAGVGTLFLALSGVAVLAMAALSRVIAPPRERSSATAMWADLKEGAGFAFRDRPTRMMLMVVAFTESVGFATLFMLPVVVRDLLDADAVTLGLLTSLWGVGGVTATLAISALGDIYDKGRVFVGAAIAFGVFLLIFSFSRSLPLSLALIFLAGGAGSIYDTMGNTLAQTIAPEAMRGRVSGFYTLMMSGVQIGAFGMGGVAEVRGIAFAVGLGGSIVAGNAIRLAPLARRLTERSAMQSRAGSPGAGPDVPQTEDR